MLGCLFIGPPLLICFCYLGGTMLGLCVKYIYFLVMEKTFQLVMCVSLPRDKSVSEDCVAMDYPFTR